MKFYNIYGEKHRSEKHSCCLILKSNGSRPSFYKPAERDVDGQLVDFSLIRQAAVVREKGQPFVVGEDGVVEALRPPFESNKCLPHMRGFWLTGETETIVVECLHDMKRLFFLGLCYGISESHLKSRTARGTLQECITFDTKPRLRWWTHFLSKHKASRVFLSLLETPSNSNMNLGKYVGLLRSRILLQN